jgi:very-short-patch-repair endonuclease
VRDGDAPGDTLGADLLVGGQLHGRQAFGLHQKLQRHTRCGYAPGFAQNGSRLRVGEQEVDKTESPFEKEVLKRLTAAGFKVRTQWEVGYYRIDMVVEGGGKRLAVECDGDRYHPIEKLADDMERQSVLERLGWQFARIRGSAFFRDPDLAMKSVLERLEEIGILPEIHRPEEYSTDMTLINELDQLINEGIDLIDDDDQVSVKEKENSSSETSKDKASSFIKLEELILSYGQAVHISELCKDISIDRQIALGIPAEQ